MKRKNILLVFSILLITFRSGIAWAIVEKKIGTVTIKANSGTRDIMPFLEDIVARWGQHLDSLYGEYKNEKIVIQLNSNGNYFVFTDVKKIGYAVAYEVATIYPLAEASITISAPESERAWHMLEWTVVEGEIIDYTER